ncbi:hypothetical protein ACS0TY_026374 [Phlomoides rotata]
MPQFFLKALIKKIRGPFLLRLSTGGSTKRIFTPSLKIIGGTTSLSGGAMVKSTIKTWKKQNGTTMSKEIEEIEEKLSKLDTKLECEEWEEDDREHRRNL